MFIKLAYFGSKICIVSIEIFIVYKAVKTYAFYTHPSFYVFILDAVFPKVKVLKYDAYKCPSFSKLFGIPSAHVYEICLKW